MQEHIVDLESVFSLIKGSNVLVLPDPPVYTVVAVSEDYLADAGVSRAELIGKGLFDVFPNDPSDPDKTSENAVRASLEFVLQNKAHHHLPVHRYDVADSKGIYTERYWTTDNKPVLNASNEVTYIIHNVEDITARVHSERREAEIKSIESFYSLFLQAPVAICIVKGDDYVVELANEDMFQILGRTSEMIGKPIIESLPEARVQGLMAILDQVRQTAKPYHVASFPASILINGIREERYFDLIFKPYFQDPTDAAPSGIFCVAHNITQQLQIQKQVEESEEKYRTLFQTMDQGFCIIDVLFNQEDQPVDYRFIEINPVFEKQTGLQNALGKTALELVPNLESYWLKLYGDVALTGESTRFVERSNAMDRWFEVYAFRVGGSQSRKVALLFSDITERQKTEEMEEKARLAVDAAELGTYDVNLVTNELVASARMQTIFDVDTAYDRQRYISAIHPEDQPIREQAYQESYQTGILEYEARLIKKDQSIRWIRVKGRVLFIEGNKPAKLLGVVQDITEEKEFAEELSKQVHEQTAELLKAHTALVETNSYFHHIINQFDAALAALVPVYEGDKIIDFYFKMTNDAYTAYANLSPAAIKGKRVSEVFPGYYQTDAFKRYVSVFESGNSENWELHYNVDHLNVFLVITASKMNEEVLVNFTDITELKNLQLDLLRNIEELQRSNKNLEEFAYAASHDLKEPTRKIHVFSERIKDSLGDRMSETEKRYFERMELASRRMSTLIDDLLTYSEVSQKSGLEEEVDMNVLIDQVLSDLDLEIEQKKAIVQVAPLFKFKGNRRQLQQAFQNLISNALKYSKSDVPPTIIIACKKVKGGETGKQLTSADLIKTFYQLTVTDNGIGFEQEDADRIFNVFTRLHGMSEYKGTGVGLSIVRKVVENYKGYIWATSALNQGSTFTLLLPAE